MEAIPKQPAGVLVIIIGPNYTSVYKLRDLVALTETQVEILRKAQTGVGCYKYWAESMFCTDSSRAILDFTGDTAEDVRVSAECWANRFSKDMIEVIYHDDIADNLPRILTSQTAFQSVILFDNFRE